MYKFSYITDRTAHITATQCMLNLYSTVRKTEHHVQKRNIDFACDVRSDAHYGRYANGCKIVHNTFSDGFDNNIDSKRIPEGNLRNLTHRLEADSKKWP